MTNPAHRKTVETALLELLDGRTRELAAPATGAPAAPTRAPHTVTATFYQHWRRGLPDEGARARSLAVMRGVTTEPRHPAFRVTPTDYKDVYSAQVGNEALLYFKVQPDRLIWLARVPL